MLPSELWWFLGACLLCVVGTLCVSWLAVVGANAYARVLTARSKDFSLLLGPLAGMLSDDEKPAPVADASPSEDD